MFGALQQGSTLYILEKGKTPILKTGQVLNITQPSNFLIGAINVKVGEDNMDFRNIPSSLSVVTYSNVIIAETKELMLNEVENLLLNSKNIINSVDYHNSVITSCEEILKELNPRFAKEKERDADINNLKTKIGGIEDKMDQIITMLSKK